MSTVDEESQWNREYLLDAAAWQDSLMQSYRALHITIQSILLALAAGLFVAVLSLESLIGAVGATGVLVIVWLFQHRASQDFKGIILFRGEDINFWHREIILNEAKLLPETRYFTKFKVYQKLQRMDADYLENTFLSDRAIEAEEAQILVEKGLGHTRRAVDEQLFRRMSWIWLIFVIGSLAYTGYRVIFGGQMF